MKRGTGVAIVVALTLGSTPAWAARTRFHEAAESQVYSEKTGGMIGRGLLNTVTSFVDVLVNVVNETKAGPPFVGTLVGVAKGAGCGVLRLGSGVVDVVTFWVPGFNGFPVSDSYTNCLAGTPMAQGSMAAPSPMAIQPDIPSIEPASIGEPIPVAEPPTPRGKPAKSWKK